MRRRKSSLKSGETVFAGIWVNTSRRKKTISNWVQTHYIKHTALSWELWQRRLRASNHPLISKHSYWKLSKAKASCGCWTREQKKERELVVLSTNISRQWKWEGTSLNVWTQTCMLCKWLILSTLNSLLCNPGQVLPVLSILVNIKEPNMYKVCSKEPGTY